MIRVRPTLRVLKITAAALAVPLLLFPIAAGSRAPQATRLPTLALALFAIVIGARELTRQGGPKRKDLLVIILGFAGLSFIVIVGYFARPL